MDVCQQWEAAAKPAIDAGVRTVFLRTGIVLTPKGGALKKLLLAFRIGAGGRFGNGKQWQSWITLDDEIGAIQPLAEIGALNSLNRIHRRDEIGRAHV